MYRSFYLALFVVVVVFISINECSALRADEPNMRVSTWKRGLSIDSVADPEMRMYLWFYEWQLFDAIKQGQMTHGVWTGRGVIFEQRHQGLITLPTSVSENQLTGSVVAADQGIKLDMKAVDDGAELTLRVENRSKHDWPPPAAVIPCFSPGPEATRNEQFANTDTYFLSATGLRPLALRELRELHFNRSLRVAVDAEADADGKYVWSSKWPKSDVDAVGGLMIRESTDRQWVTGIAWERFVSVQGHNPWKCMHLSINVGPLKRTDTRTVRGRIYLFRGTKQDLLARYEKEFNQR